MKTNPLTRRHFLRAAGTVIALPALESIGFRRFASAAAVVARPKRVVFLGFGWGVTEESWYPDAKVTGAQYKLPPGLAPLARHQSDFTVVQGLTNKFANEAHWGSTFWLTGANRYAEPGQSFHNSISADQVAAAALGKDTRFTSIQLGSPDATNNGHGPGLSLAWDQRGKPLAGMDNPVLAYHRLFSDDAMPLAQRQAMLAQKRSVLDAVRTDAKRVQRGLSKADTDKLDEYFQGVRDIETRLSKDEQWLNVPKQKAPFDEPKPGLAGRDEIKLMYDLIVAALQTDATRVITYRQPVGTLINSLGLKIAPHDMSHYTTGDRLEASQRRDVTQSELLAGLLDKLKAVKEPDGTSLFDHTALAYGSNIRTSHYLDNCPTILAGGGARLKLGQHLVLPRNTPLCNAWLTMLHGLGIEAERHGDSSGVVKALMI
ncbi:DUF1552 domain-containing protein [Prosthecobacter sp.]|uniref:DUF1552 domain-containing protein n=1 Tax=Prosthecobacter sp. TaxID=1965333 RepID=UPI002ABBADC8|nr:DUF1552 domain-containing protein [Prosthecobacter sp.]MDZ4401728.1 DUF1552 domain-containing protein [Prosthecobacter sp.]